MNKNHDKPELISAFPREDYQCYRAPGQSGMTLRDYFAAKALQGFLADSSQRLIAEAIKEDERGKLLNDSVALTKAVNYQLAAGCYALADAMLAARNEAQP